jgi:hypothetical protein
MRGGMLAVTLGTLEHLDAMPWMIARPQHDRWGEVTLAELIAQRLGNLSLPQLDRPLRLLQLVFRRIPLWTLRPQILDVLGRTKGGPNGGPV